MRGRFNTTCTITAGPGTATPGMIRGVFPCRLVIEDGIHSVQLGSNQPWIPSYITLDRYRPVGIFTSPEFSVNVDLADRVSVPSSAAPAWFVFYTDWIRWRGRAKYYRSYLVSIEEPRLRVGGVLIGGKSIVQPGTSGGGGGVLIGGGAAGFPVSSTAHAGVIIGGIASVVPGSPYRGKGTVLIGGGATIVPSSPYLAKGGLLIGGHSTIVPGYPYVGKGGLLIGGLALVVPGFPFLGHGEILIGGYGSTSPPTATILIIRVQPSPTITYFETIHAHGYVTGDTVQISNMTSHPECNGVWSVIVPSPNPLGTFFGVHMITSGPLVTEATGYSQLL